jgi:hypothetical protein
MRRVVAEALVKIGKPAVEPLKAALKNKNAAVQQTVAEVLGEIGDPRAVNDLMKTLMDSDWKKRQTAVQALVKVGKPAENRLIAALKAKDAQLRKTAAEVLGKIGWQPDTVDLRVLYWIALQEWDKCVNIGKPSIMPLVAVLKDPNSRARRAAAETLERLAWEPGTEAERLAYWSIKVEVLIGQLASGNHATREQAAKSLVKLYQSDKIDQKNKRMILNQQARIMQRHHDARQHTDRTTEGVGLVQRDSWGQIIGTSDCYGKTEHTDNSDHTDQGIGVDFPIT